MLLTIKELISALELERQIFGDNAPVALDDADTGWHMKIKCVTESDDVRGRILISGAGYSDNSCLEK